MSDIQIGALSLPGFNAAIGADIALSGLTVALASDQVTGTFPVRIVGMGGFKITLPNGVYDVKSVESVSALTLTTNYAGSGGTVSGTLHKFVIFRVYALSSFVPSGSSETVQQATPGSNDWFRRYGVSIINDGAQNVAHIPEIVLPATTNSSVPTARYFGGLYAQAGQFIKPYPDPNQFKLNHLTTPTSWAQVVDFNTPAPPAPVLNPDSFYSKQQIDARFPSGLADELLYFQSAGNVLSRLSLDPGDFQITAGVLEALNVTKQLQEEGSDLPIRNKINFVGSAYTATDDLPNNRTNVTADADLNALASNATNGIYARTGAGTVAARTITGTANRIGVVDGDGVGGNPTLDIGSDVVTLTGSQTLTNKGVNLANNTLTGTTAEFNTALSDGDFATLAGSGTLTNKSVNLANNTLTGTISQFNTALSDGDFATLAGAETLTNKTLTNPRIGADILDSNGNEILRLSATGSAVNNVRVINNIAGQPPFVTAFGDDTNIDLNITGQGTGRVKIPGYAFALEVNTTTVGNVGAGLDTLHSYTLPANSLAANGDYLKVRYAGTFAVNETDKRVNVTFGGQNVQADASVDMDLGSWFIDIDYTRLTSTTVLASFNQSLGSILIASGGTVDGGRTAFFKPVTIVLTVADLGANTMAMAVLGEGAADNDVVQRLSRIELTQR